MDIIDAKTETVKCASITDKAFTRMLWQSVFGILACVIALCAGTWAWFTVSVDGTSRLTAGQFDIFVSVKNVSDEPAIDVPLSENTVFLSPGEYAVELRSVSTAKGFCAVTVNGDGTYLTPVLDAGMQNGTDARTTFRFYVRITADGESVLRFISCWGRKSEENTLTEDAVLEVTPDGVRMERAEEKTYE